MRLPHFLNRFALSGLLLLACLGCSSEPGLQLPADMPVFLLLGQSNMVGMAPLEPGDQQPYLRAQVLNLNGRLKWQTAQHPLDNADGEKYRILADKNAAFGSGIAFANAMVEKYPQGLALLLCARDSTSITAWQPVSSHPDTAKKSLFAACAQRLKNSGAVPQLRGIVIAQGEADALDPGRYASSSPDATGWGEKFQRLVGSLRDLADNPTLPVVYNVIGSNQRPEAFTQWQAVQQQQRAVADRCIKPVESADLPLFDNVHFSRRGYIMLGQRQSAAMTKALESCQ